MDNTDGLVESNMKAFNPPLVDHLIIILAAIRKHDRTMEPHRTPQPGLISPVSTYPDRS